FLLPPLLPPTSTLFPYTTSSDLNGGSCTRERFPHAPVGEPDPYQAGELVVGQRVCLGTGAGRGPVPLPGAGAEADHCPRQAGRADRKSTRLNSSHVSISYAVFCL